jgi:hypothetical protein
MTGMTTQYSWSERARRRLAALAALALWAWVAGCATTEAPNSDLPWNAPQPWEGSPLIPGLESR